MILPPNAIRLSQEIELWVIPNFASPQECQTIIDEGTRKGFVASTVDDPTKHDLPEGRILHQARTSTTSFPLAPEAPKLAELGERIKAIVGDYKLEGLQVQRYEKTQRYDSHYDTFDNVDEDAQRNYTAMLYLNTLPEGGATLFKILNIRIQPTQGTLVLWNNLLPNGCRDTNTLHGGEPVTGDIAKYITTYWFRKRKGEVCDESFRNVTENFTLSSNTITKKWVIGISIGLLSLLVIVGLAILSHQVLRRKR